MDLDQNMVDYMLTSGDWWHDDLNHPWSITFSIPTQYPPEDQQYNSNYTIWTTPFTPFSLRQTWATLDIMDH